MVTEDKPSIASVHQRALEESNRDSSLADEALAAADAIALHKMCKRLIRERMDLAQGIDALGRAMVVLREPNNGPNADAVEAVERIAKESIDFAREVFRLIYQPPAKS